MARSMTDEERRAFLLDGTRTGKVAWISPTGNVIVRLVPTKLTALAGISD